MSKKVKSKLEDPDSIFFFARFNDAQMMEGSQELPETEKVYEIPVFREGSFKHYWYGDLEFDLSYLNKIVTNHRSRVVGVDVAFDRDHMPHEGALAWVVPGGLSIKPKALPDGRVVNVLFAMIQFTEEGVEKILQKKMFKYFSAEISEDYSTREKEPMSDGSTVVKSYGPTLIGGGFTNRPFISHLGAVFNKHQVKEADLDEVGKEVEVVVDYLDEDKDIEFAFASYRFSDKSSPQLETEEVKEVDSADKEDVQVENQTGSSEDEPVQFGLTKIGDTMKFSEFLTKMAAIQGPKERYEFAMSAQFQDANEEMIRQNILASEERAYSAQRLAEEATREANLFKTQVEKLSNENVTLSKRVLEANEVSFQSRVQAFSTELLNEGHFPAVVNEVKDILLSVAVDERKFSFSTGGEEKSDLMGIFNRVFSKLPKEYKVPEPSDLLETKPDGEETPAVPAEPAQSEENPRIAAFKKLYSQAPSEEMIPFLREDGTIDLDKAFKSGVRA